LWSLYWCSKLKNKISKNFFGSKTDWFSDWKLHFFCKNNIFRMKHRKFELVPSFDKLIQQNLSGCPSDVRWRHVTSDDVMWRQMTSSDVTWRHLTGSDVRWRKKKIFVFFCFLFAKIIVKACFWSLSFILLIIKPYYSQN
jgi:hypothetical protein